MAKLKISAGSVLDEMETAPPNKVVYYFDTELPGFGFYRTPSNIGTFFAEYRPVAGGGKKRIKLGRVGTLKANEAREAARKVIANAALGKDLAKDRADERAGLTVKEMIETYVEEFVAKKKKEASVNFYRAIANKHIFPTLGAAKAVTLTRVDIQRAHTAMSKTAKVSANRAMKLLSATFNWGSKNGYLPEGFNPASGVDLNKEEARERFLTEAEMMRLGDAMREAETIGLEVDAGSHRNAPTGQRVVMSVAVTGAIRLLMLTGCRLREILHLRWSDVDLERGLAFLPDSKTGKKTVLLSAAAVAVINEIPKVGVYIVASESAGRKDEKPRADLKRPWAAITKKAGLDGLRIHDLRHSFASVGAWSGLGLPVIGKLLGHADAKTTQRYAHIADDAARRGADVIADQIAAAMGEK